MFKFTLAAVAAVAVGAAELTPANFAAESAGKARKCYHIKNNLKCQ
jgi:hypothetical protein